MLPIGAWVLREACRQAKAWVDAGLPATTMAVNVSSIEFRKENFLEDVHAILRETGLSSRFLELELTETVLINQIKSAASTLQTLKKIGIRVAVDDFGTGYSSLAYLSKFPIDAIKIDPSFIRQLNAGGHEAIIVPAVIDLARGLKLQVIAEGVETLEELVFLQAHQCDEAQGYYFSKPVSAEEFAQLMERKAG